MGGAFGQDCRHRRRDGDHASTPSPRSPGIAAGEADVRAAFAAADRLGPVTALVANAGIVAETARVDEMDAARIERLFAVNVLGPFLCCGEAVRRLSTRHGGSGGSIVLMSSSSS